MARPQRDDRRARKKPDPVGPGQEPAAIQLAFAEQCALFPALFDRSPEGMAFLSPEFIIRAANKVFAAQLGFTPNQLIGKHARDVVADWAENKEPIYLQVHETGRPYSSGAFPLEIKEHPERGVTYWDFTVSPVYGPDNSFIGYLLVSNDVTEKKRAEEDLARLVSIVETSEDAMAYMTPDGIILDWNRGAERLYGYSSEEIRGKSVDVLVPPGRFGETARILTSIEQGRPVSHHETVRWRKDGSLVDVSLSVSPVEDKAGKVIGATWISVDITERRRAAEELRKARDELEIRVEERTFELATANEELRRGIAERERLVREVADFANMSYRRARELETVIRSLTDALLVFDTEGRIVDLNEAALKQAGLAKREEVPSQAFDYLRLLNLRHPDGRQIAPNDLALTRALNGEVVTGREEVARNPQTGRDSYLLVSSAPIRDREGGITGVVQVMSDISRLKELDKLKDDFISVAAHELKTPVTIMKGYALALLRMTDTIPPPRRKMLEAINRGADRIDRIVNDLLEISRLQSGRLELTLERIDLLDLVQEVVGRFALTATKHRIEVVKAEHAIVRADANRIEQVLNNIIDNAVKYSPEGGPSQGRIDVAVAVQDREAVFSVRDYGVGIPREKQGRIFERFYSAHVGTPYDFGGPAVGLHISKEIISRHGGRIWFESEEGKGSTFYFSLPLAERNGGN